MQSWNKQEHALKKWAHRSAFNFLQGVFCCLIVGFLAGCSVDSARSHYVLAEKLWMDRKYQAAVNEFEKVIVKDPKGKLGQQALYRAAMTQTLFLSQYNEAVRKFRSFSQVNADPGLAWEAQLQVGEILYSKLEQYDQAISHYRAMLKERTETPETPEILYRIAKSWFFLFQFDEAAKGFQEIIKKYPLTSWAEKATFQVGATHFTRGEQLGNPNSDGKDAYETAKDSFESFVKAYPKSSLVPEAQFGIASCLEELDELEDAYAAYSAIKGTYPSPQVIEIKLSRIRERIAQRSR